MSVNADRLLTLQHAHHEIQRLIGAVDARRAYIRLMERLDASSHIQQDAVMLALVAELLRWRTLRNETVRLLSKGDAAPADQRS